MNRSISFERGIDPKKAMDVGLSKTAIKITRNVRIKVIYHRAFYKGPEIGNMHNHLKEVNLASYGSIKGFFKLIANEKTSKTHRSISGDIFVSKPSKMEFTAFKENKMMDFEISFDHFDKKIHIFEFEDTFFEIECKIINSIWIL